jgi:hypothetical protein
MLEEYWRAPGQEALVDCYHACGVHACIPKFISCVMPLCGALELRRGMR